MVGLGPGGPEYLAPRAREVLRRAEVIVGYRGYIDLVDPALLKAKEIISTGMRGEVERCERAIERATEGRQTAVVSSGDPGIYGMAGLVLELLADRDLLGRIDVEVIPGIPALAAAAALLGAPLMHDFAVISLSDLMTPWEVIRTRVEAALKADLVLVIYNPRSKKRDWQLKEVRNLILKHRGEGVPVGIVRNAARANEEVRVVEIGQMDEMIIDMLSILLIGNSQTRMVGGKMVTPRGYLEKYGKE